MMNKSMAYTTLKTGIFCGQIIGIVIGNVESTHMTSPSVEAVKKEVELIGKVLSGTSVQPLFVTNDPKWETQFNIVRNEDANKCEVVQDETCGSVPYFFYWSHMVCEKLRSWTVRCK